MKKLLIALPLALCMSYAWSQTSTEKNQQTATSLDGKSYKITLMSADMNQTSKGKTMDNSKDQVGNPDQSTVDKKDHTNVDYDSKTSSPYDHDAVSQDKNNKMKNSGNETMENKTIIINFENGMINSSFLTNKKIDGCPYTITTSTAGRTDFKATCSRMTDVTSGTSTISSGGTSTSGNTPNTTPNTTDKTYSSGNTTTGESTTPGSTNNTSTGKSSINTSSGDANMSASTSSSVCTWTGTVDGKNITGYFNKMKSDGKVMSYTFTGTETTDKDMSKDLGIR
jgi:hypothetical protein